MENFDLSFCEHLGNFLDISRTTMEVCLSLAHLYVAELHSKCLVPVWTPVCSIWSSCRSLLFLVLGIENILSFCLFDEYEINYHDLDV